MAEFAVVDLETTGYEPGRDRIVEIAIVRLSGQDVVDEWCTLVDPGCAVRHGHVHGIYTRHVKGAPSFHDIAPDIASRVENTVLVAHNARFDSAFLAAEFARAGMELPLRWLCTLELVSRLEFGFFRSLRACCTSLGVPHDEGAHSALIDARATARLLSFLLGLAYERRMNFALPPPLTVGPLGRDPCGRVLPRPKPPPPVRLRRLAARPHATPMLPSVDPTATAEYVALLDDILEDRQVSHQEAHALADLALEWGFGRADLAVLHRQYVRELARAALADGQLTRVGMSTRTGPTLTLRSGPS